MTPRATLAHHIDGRTRFRIPDKRGDREYFARVIEKLEQCPGVVSVTANDMTASVLIIHEANDVDVLTSYARTFELFDSADADTKRRMMTRPPGEILGHRFGQLDGWVRAQTGRTTDLRSLALTGLLGTALWQMLRGRILPEAVTLLWYAFAVVANGQRHSANRPEHPAGAQTSGAEPEAKA
jgi:Heavy metal associated domain 2